MTDQAWVVFFTVIFPIFLVPGVLGFHVAWLVYLVVFPSVLSTIEEYLILWFIFEVMVMASMFIKNLVPGSRERSIK